MTASSPARPRGLTTSATGAEATVARRRNVPLALFGLLIVVGCALAFALISVSVGDRRPVLMVVRDLPAGTVLSASDVAAIRADVPAPVQAISEAELRAVIGRPTAVPVAARTLLTREAFAARSFPPSGQVVLGLALKAGRLPPDLVAGARIQVFRVTSELETPSAVPAADGSAAALPMAAATVLKVERTQDGQGHVVEIQLSKDDVPQVASAAAVGAVTLVLVSVGG